ESTASPAFHASQPSTPGAADSIPGSTGVIAAAKVVVSDMTVPTAAPRVSESLPLRDRTSMKLIRNRMSGYQRSLRKARNETAGYSDQAIESAANASQTSLGNLSGLSVTSTAR